MAADPTLRDGGLDVLLFGRTTELEVLRFELECEPAVARVRQVADARYAWDQVRSGPVQAIVIDLDPRSGDIDATLLMVFRIREEFPEIVFALFGDDRDFDATMATVAPDVRARLDHYHRVPRSFEPADVKRLPEVVQALRRDLPRAARSTPRYAYDVALSFAGEERPYADELAKLLTERGVRVFYDSFERAQLWGKNLVDHLYQVYSKDARYCIIFVSAAYAEKMWTNHERQAAQERALNNRGDEYLLPVQIDDTQLPGLPSTVAYVNISGGIPEIAEQFLKKLGAVLGSDRSSG